MAETDGLSFLKKKLVKDKFDVLNDKAYELLLDHRMLGSISQAEVLAQIVEAAATSGYQLGYPDGESDGRVEQAKKDQQEIDEARASKNQGS